MLRSITTVTSLFLVCGAVSIAGATTYQVGPTRTYKQLSAIAATLKPGDVVELDGGAIYAGGVVFDKAGSAAQRITIRGVPVGGARPVISGGTNTIEARAGHYVFEQIDLTAGSFRCFFQHADDVTLRDSIVHDCPQHGVLGADSDSGSFLLERTEVHHCGSGTQLHQIYMSSDEVAFPSAVFRMQGCYVHDGNGGNNIKSRAGRNEIYGNWVEGALYHELELIGSETSPEGAVREDSDVVGNVFIKRGGFYVTRFGGDGTGQTNGRYRFVNNTVITQGGSAVFRIMDGIESLEFHNNVFAAATGQVSIVDDGDAAWVGGAAAYAGSNNFIPTGAGKVPSGLTGTVSGVAPGLTNIAMNDLRPTQGAVIVEAGAAAPAGPAAHAFPNPLVLPTAHPPLHSLATAPESRSVVGKIDIGAYELGGGSLGPSVTPPPGGSGDGGTVGSTGDGGPQGGTDDLGGVDNSPGDGSQGGAGGGPSSAASKEPASGGCSLSGRGSDNASSFAFGWLLSCATLVVVRRRTRQPPSCASFVPVAASYTVSRL